MRLPSSLTVSIDSIYKIKLLVYICEMKILVSVGIGVLLLEIISFCRAERGKCGASSDCEDDEYPPGYWEEECIGQSLRE